MHGGHRWYRGSRMVSCWSMHRTLLEGVPSLPCLVMLECLPICWWYGLIGRVITLVIFGHYQYLQGQTCSVRSGWPTADGWLSVSEQLCSIGLSYAIISIANLIFSLHCVCCHRDHIILSHDVMNLFWPAPTMGTPCLSVLLNSDSLMGYYCTQHTAQVVSS